MSAKLLLLVLKGKACRMRRGSAADELQNLSDEAPPLCPCRLMDGSLEFASSKPEKENGKFGKGAEMVSVAQ